MKEEDVIDAVAWQLAQGTEEPSKIEALETQEVERYRQGEHTSAMEQRLSTDDRAREQLLESAGITQKMPSVSIRERVLASKFPQSPPQPRRVRSFVQWAAAVAVIGVGLALFFALQPAPVVNLATAEFAQLEFKVTATGLQEFRGSYSSASQVQPAPAIQISVNQGTTIAVVIESSVTPTRPVQYALFQQTGTTVHKIPGVVIQRYPGAVEMSVSPSQLSFSDRAQQRLYVVAGRRSGISAQEVLSSFENPDDVGSDLRVFPVEVTLLDQ